MTKTRMLALLILLSATTLVPAKQLGWKQLFDGHDLHGWKHVGPGSFTVEHGLLKTQGGMGLLYSTVGPVGRLRDQSGVSDGARKR